MRQLFFTVFLTIFGLNVAWAADPSIARGIFTNGIENREPVDNLETFPVETQKVYFFTDLRSFEGQTVTHRWMFNGNEMASLNFNVKGPRWRVYSSKNMIPEWEGTWTVDVLNQNQELVQSFEFDLAASQ